MRSCVLVEAAATAMSAALAITDADAAEGVTAARGEGRAIVAAGGSNSSSEGGVGAPITYGKQVGIGVVGARSSRRATVAAMNFGLGPRTKAIYIRSVG